MRSIVLVVVSLFVAALPALSQSETVTAKVHVVLVDADLNQKPVPHLSIVITADSGAAQSLSEWKTDFSGVAELHLPPGKYRLSTPQGVDFQGRHFSWETELDLSGGTPAVSLDLSNDNAHVAEADRAESSRKPDELTLMFQKYRNSVVTVWSEIGSGTGFIVDPAGLVMTNQHVVGPSTLLSVQFDAKRKVAAKVLAIDAERDVAVLYADLSAFPGAIAAPIASGRPRRDLAVEGEKVFTIGSPLGLKKIITSGIVSKVEERAIISDVNINHGNSGGPLFNLSGEVIGITTFLVPGANGPGVAGIVRIDRTFPVLDEARKKMKDVSLPSARLLPVEPSDPYPLESLKAMAKSGKVDIKPYVFSAGGFDVALATPVLEYELQAETDKKVVEQNSRRTRRRGDPRPAEPKFEPLHDLHGWSEYLGDFKPVLLVQAAPQLRETLGSLVGRELVPETQFFSAPRLKFKTDFYRMKLLCGEREVEPIQPGKAATVLNTNSAFVKVTDATYVGIYSYSPDAISTACGKVALELYSEREPEKAVTKELDRASIERVSDDFRPYIAIHGNAGN